jgi:AcrR family transcriptional regulator
MSPDERKEDRRRRLLDTALELFGTRGYAATTITQVCATAGVTPNKFYEVFETKEVLLIELGSELLTEIVVAMVNAVAEMPLDVERRAYAGSRAFCHGMLDDPRRGRVLLIEVVGVSEAVTDLRHRFLRWNADLFLNLITALPSQAHLHDDPEVSHIVAMGAVGAGNEVLVDWLLSGGGPSIDKVADTLALVYVRIITDVAGSGPAAPPATGEVPSVRPPR